MPDDHRTNLVSVIIVNFNGRHFLQDCLSSLLKQTYSPFEVILVDNASQDGSVAFVEEHFPHVKFFIQKENLGFAGGSNAGIREAHGEYILTLNNDTIVSPDFIEELVQPMRSDPSVGMCASKMIFPDGRINSTGICISRSGAAWDRGGGEPDRGQYELPEEVFGPCAGAALYRRAMLDEIGFFDEDFFLYMEDVDLAFRAQLSGRKCLYVPKAIVVHFHRGTTGFNSDISIYYGNRNLVWYVVKNYPARIFIIYLPWLAVRNTADIIYYTKQGMLWTILRAKWDMIKGIGHMIKKRQGIQRTVSDRYIEHWILMWNTMRGSK